MERYYNLNISSPCTEDFNSFTPTKNGGFCASCTKEVVDFTKMNTNEISDYFNKSTSKNTCGRFTPLQLQTEIEIPKKRNLISILGGLGLACIALFSFSTSNAQNTKNITSNLDEDDSKTQDVSHNNVITVKGTVIASSDKLPLPGVNIILEGTAIGTQTNFDGEFTFPKKLKKGDVLIFSFVSMKSQKIIIQDEKTATNVALKVDMTSCDLILMGKVATKEIYKSAKKN